MAKYPVILKPHPAGGYTLISPDFNLSSGAEDLSEARAEAQLMLDLAKENDEREGKPLPKESRVIYIEL